MPYNLKSVKLKELSFVGRGANKRKRFLLLKSDEGHMPEELLELLETELPENIQKALEEMIEKQKLSDEDLDKIKAIMRIRNGMTTEEAKSRLMEMLRKVTPKDEYPTPTAKQKTPEEEEEEKKKTKKAGHKNNNKYPSPLKKEDLEAFPKEQRPHLEALLKSNEESIKKSEKLEKELQTERDARITKEFVEKAQNFKKIPMTPAEFGPVLKSIKELMPEQYDSIYSLFEKVDKELEESHLFKELGSSTVVPISNAEDKLNAKAKELVQKSAGKLNYNQAYSQIMKSSEGQRLYEEFDQQRVARR